MSDPLLTFLKYIFLALLYLFFLRVLRAVWTELREPEAAPAPGGPPGYPNPVPPGPLPRPVPLDRLVVIAPPEHEGRTYPLRDELTVGRASGCVVNLADDTFVSQLHARVFRRENEYFVEDLGSTNGTFLNGQRVGAPVALRAGDRLQIGNTILGLAQ